MADTSKINLGQLKTALTQAKNYTDGEIANLTNTVEPNDSDMPKVFFNGDKPTNKTSVYATIEYKSKTENFKGYVDIKCQGNSSMAYPKKNYTIKMFSDEARSTKLKKDFKGWGKQSKFCLKANYIDHSHARNIISAKLWDEIVASRANYTELPELLRTSPRNGAIDGFPIKVYYNNTYEGVYTWNIPKDKWTFNMDDMLDNHCVLCSEEYNSGCFRSANASLWSDEIHDVMPESIKTSFNNFISFVINSTDDEFKTNLENYVYVDSLIDYYIFQYVICGLDSMGKNQLFATYDGAKWIATSYDMDSTFGLYWNGQRFVSDAYRMQEDYESMLNGNPGNLLYIRLEKLFIDEIKTRYAELRANILSYANIVDKFERFMDIIGPDLYAEDLTIYTGIPSGNTNNIQQIRNYIRDRLTYVDKQINTVRCTGIVLSNDSLSFTTTDPQTLSVVLSPDGCTETVYWSVSPHGIVKVNDGVVTPVTNGECTITATCGSYSDTCSVTVSGIEEGGGGEITEDSDRFYIQDGYAYIDPTTFGRHSLTNMNYDDTNDTERVRITFNLPETRYDASSHVLFNGVIPYNETFDGNTGITDETTFYFFNPALRVKIPRSEYVSANSNVNQALYNMFIRLPIKLTTTLAEYPLTNDIIDKMSGNLVTTPNEQGCYNGFINLPSGGIGIQGTYNAFCNKFGCISDNCLLDREDYAIKITTRFYYNVPANKFPNGFTLDAFKTYLKSLGLVFYF